MDAMVGGIQSRFTVIKQTFENFAAVMKAQREATIAGLKMQGSSARVAIGQSAASPRDRALAIRRSIQMQELNICYKILTPLSYSRMPYIKGVCKN